MNPEREPFGERGLADAGLADQERVVLAPAAEHLHHPFNLGRTPDQGINRPFAARATRLAA